jgi:HrpA-like RNA helicase
VADRVAYERGEGLGQLVGYQIRLESKVSPRTLLTFCTNGVLLRTLMGGDAALQTVTHIIVDEIHERDRFSDLLLAVLRDLLPRLPNLTLVLMSATFDTQRFSDYFDRCPILTIPGRLYDVRSLFLEDILRLTKFKDADMQSYTRDYQVWKKRESHNLMQWCQQDQPHAVQPDEAEAPSPVQEFDYGDKEDAYKLVDELLKQAWSGGEKSCFEDLLSLYINEDLDVDYRHPETGVTPLIVSAARGMIDFVEPFLSMGADVSIRTKLNDFDAIHWAQHFGHTEIADLISSYVHSSREERDREADEVAKAHALSQEDKELLEAYHRTFNDDVIDLDLILTLTKHICLNGRDEPPGAILIFLPGYDEIVTLKNMIVTSFEGYRFFEYVLFTLHSQMQNEDHRRVFEPAPPGKRKIILSTNIAETSVTIEDVVYVIDSGKVKEKSYDSTTGVLELKAVRISQANAVQRRGRAGRCRPGICYHLYSRFRFENLPAFQVPEIVRMPAHELCLQVKLLAPNKKLAEFVARLPDPPSDSSIRNSVALLKAIDAFDSSENLTELGLLLLDMPIEPHLGKVVLHAVVMKCLDPVLTIVCALTYRDPFLMPANQLHKKEAQNAKLKLSCNTLSDHMTVLRAFQGWQKAKCDNFEQKFCRTNFVSPSTMEMIFGIRTQLLGQLRASGFVRARGASDIRDLNTNSENWAVVKAVLCAGYFPNVLRVDPQRGLLMSRNSSRISFHPSSVLGAFTGRGKKKMPEFPSEWFIYDELCRSGARSLARCCTIISPVTMALLAGPMRLPTDAWQSASNEGAQSASEDEPDDLGPVTLKIDDWITFRLTHDVGNLIWQLRQKWHSLFLRRISSPGRQLSNADALVIKTIADVLNLEEQSIGIPQPVGVGQRPAPMASTFCSPVINNHNNNPFPNDQWYNNRMFVPGRQQLQQPGGSSSSGGRSPRSGVMRSPRSQNYRRY